MAAAALLVPCGCLTLENTPGVRPRFAPGRHVVVSHTAATAGDYTVRGLTFEHGTIRVAQSGLGAMRVAVVGNAILHSETGPFGAIDVTTLTLGGALTGGIRFDVRDNDVVARRNVQQAPVGIRVDTESKADAGGVVRETASSSRSRKATGPRSSSGTGPGRSTPT